MSLKVLTSNIPIKTVANEAPKEFRIWKAGNNPSDHGDAYFTEDSAKLLMEEQKIRGNKYSIDYNHMSLLDAVLPESTKAAGWHWLEVRKDAQGKQELWAIDVEWTPNAKSGLEAKVPEWRYFSPAFYKNEDNLQITSYINTALCINPATHHNTMLASRTSQKTNTILRNKIMDKEKLQALKDLMALVSAEGITPDMKAKLQPAIDALVAELGGPEAVDALMKAELVNEEASKIVEANKVAADKKVEVVKEADKKVEAPKDAGVELAVQVAELTSRLAKQDVEKLVLANVNKIPASLKDWALTQDINTITGFLAKAPLISPTTVTQVKTTVAVKGEDKQVKVNADLGAAYILNSFGLGPKPDNGTTVVSKDFVDGTKNKRAIFTSTPKQYKASKAAKLTSK